MDARLICNIDYGSAKVRGLAHGLLPPKFRFNQFSRKGASMFRRLVFVCLLAATTDAVSQDYQIETLDRTIEVQTARPMLTGTTPPVVLKKRQGDVNTFVPNQWIPKKGDDVKLVTFNVTYNGNPPAQVQTAFEHALNIWSLYIDSPIDIEVEMNWTPIPGDVLGSAGPTTWLANFPSAPTSNNFYPIALANRFASMDLRPGVSDIECDFDADTSWYFGLDGNAPSGQYDFVTVVLHEIAHGLGFASSARVEQNGTGEWGFGGYTLEYDKYLVNGDGRQITNTVAFPNPSIALGDEFTGNDLHFYDDEIAYRYRLYAPSTFDQGSSVSHLDEMRFPAGDPNSLMTPGLFAAEAIHDPGPLSLNIFRCFGWHDEESPIFETNTALGLASCYGQAGVCYKITLDANWTAEIVGDSLIITTGTGSVAYDASQPNSFFSSDASGYVAFTCGSRALSSLEFGSFGDNLAFYADNLLRGIPIRRQVLRDGQPVSATERFDVLSQGQQIDDSKPAYGEFSKATQRLTATPSNMGTTAGKVIFETPDGNLRIVCQKVRNVRGELDIYYQGQHFLNEYGDPHIVLPLQGGARLQQGDREVVFILPDERTAVYVKTHDVCRKRDRIIEEVKVFDTKGQHYVHQVSGLNGSLPVDYSIASRAGSEIPSDLYYASLLKSLQGDLAFLSANGKLTGYNVFLDQIMDYELHLVDRCNRSAFNPVLVACIQNELGITLQEYFIEASGTQDGTAEAWMQYHVDLFNNP